MATGKSIITGALRLLKVKQSGEELEPSELDDGLEALNELIEYWNNQEWLQSTKTHLTKTLTTGQTDYTIGSGGDLNETWPLRIELAHINTNSQDYGIEIIDVAQYEDIYQKSLTSFYPSYLYYDRTYPLGTIKLWPAPTQAFTLKLTVYAQIPLITNATATISLPPSYTRALRYNLATELVSEYDTPNTYQITAQKAKESLDKLKAMNASPVRRMQFESAYVTRSNRYNIRTGTT